MSDYSNNPYPQQPGQPEQQPSPKGFFAALFDFSFGTFITPIIVKVVYVISVVLIGLGWLIYVIFGFAKSPGLGLLILIVGAVAALVYLAFIRMTLEFYLAIVRMSEDIHRRMPGGPTV